MDTWKVITDTNCASDSIGSPPLYEVSLTRYEVWKNGVRIGGANIEPGNWRTAHAAAARQAQRRYNVPLYAEHVKLGTDYIQ